MKTRHAVFITSLMLLFSMSPVLAQDSDEDQLDATMRLMCNAEAQLPEAVIKTIELPAHLREDAAAASDSAASNSKKGHDQANAAREGRKQGLEAAADARDKAKDMKEAAKENRENHGRSEDLPDPPNRPDDVPNPSGR